MLMMVKNSVRVSRLKGEVPRGCRDSMLADNVDLRSGYLLPKSYSGDVYNGTEVNYDEGIDDEVFLIHHFDGLSLSPTWDASCQRRSLVDPEEICGMRNGGGALKYLKVPLKKEWLGSQLSSIKHEFCKDCALCNSFQVRDDIGVEKTIHKMNAQRDVEAAHALMEMANHGSNLCKNDLYLCGKEHDVKGMLDIEVLITEVNEDEVSCNIHSRLAAKKAKKHSGKFQQSVVEDQIERHNGEMVPCSLLQKKRKRKLENDFSLPLSKHANYSGGEDEDLCENIGLLQDHALPNRLRKGEWQNNESCASNGHPQLGVPLARSNWITKKQRWKAYMKSAEGPGRIDDLHSSFYNVVNEDAKCMKNPEDSPKVDIATGSLSWGASNLPFSRGSSIVETVEKRAMKKHHFTVITPTIQSGFSFSIIHLLSAVRTALVTTHAEYDASAHNEHWGNSRHGFHSHHDRGISDAKQTEQKNLPSLTIHEIVRRVRENPGDPWILETQEPLQDLVKGILRIFSSRTAPLGAKGWTALTFYQKVSKSWSWIGPLSSFDISNHNCVGEEISPEAWGVPRRILVKLVDSFADWLKGVQLTLQQIGSLPAPPATLMQSTVNAKERFKDLRGQKSLTTINPSTEEVRAYFQREETIRYLVPERTFSYTAADGRKSTVAPLRKCSGKPSSKARHHFMLRPNRPPHVTILCLVRDAAARLPGGIGTRADVCTLIRDSKFIAEDVSETQINQVVSGALDRLHYELDPCVQFDKDRQFWVYLHGGRDEDDFEYNGASTTKNWKRKQRNVVEQSVQENSYCHSL
ncbi:uncharacterized protein LOC131159900 [Malania oleifera]|uniref:uncharacterized protein LOC131159900 n=1 Tax=Malania oleifera TaxID=397392 RepID=UPI0025AE16E4|nr:uncharacterized protein LOC131159900 [Malania oleifera]